MPRSAPSSRTRATVRWLISGLAAIAPGCVTVEQRPAHEVQRVLEPPGDLDEKLIPFGTYHNVRISLEIAPGDLPAGLDVTPALLPRYDESGEVYRAFDVHEFTYDRVVRVFEVGGYRYPLATDHKGARLWIFKTRDGDLRFAFHDQDIAIRSEVRWKPSLYHATVVDRSTAGGGGPKEILRVGLSEIVVDPATGVWQVDGQPFQPGESDLLEIRDAVEFRGR